MNGKIAVACMTAATPSVNGKAKSAHDASFTVLTTRTPLLLPSHEIGGNAEFFAVNIFARPRDIEVLKKEVQGIHLQLRRGVLHGTHGDYCSLWMIWGAPCACGTDVGANRSVLLAL